MAMIFPQITTADAFTQLRNQRRAMRDYLTMCREKMTAAQCDAALVLAIPQHCKSQLALWDSLSQVSGLAAYIRSAVNDPNFDVAAEYAALRQAYVDLRDGIRSLSAAITDANGWLLIQRLEADGSITTRQFTAAQLVQAVALVDAALSALG